MSQAFVTLQDAVEADAFPDVDLALRRGRHIDRDDSDWYAFLVDAQPWLEAFYHRFGCELIHRADFASKAESEVPPKLVQLQKELLAVARAILTGVLSGQIELLEDLRTS